MIERYILICSKNRVSKFSKLYLSLNGKLLGK